MSTAPCNSTANSRPNKCHERFVTIRSRPPIFVVLAGHMEPDGSPSSEHTVLFFNGFIGTAWSDFRPQLERLPDLLPSHWSVVAMDQPGRGKSRPPHEPAPLDWLERNATAGADVMQALGVKSYMVVGWCGGGVSAMLLATQQPQHVHKLVLCGTTALVDRIQLGHFESKVLLLLWCW